MHQAFHYTYVAKFCFWKCDVKYFAKRGICTSWYPFQRQEDGFADLPSQKDCRDKNSSLSCLLGADKIQVWKIIYSSSPHISDLFLRGQQGRTRDYNQKTIHVKGCLFSLYVSNTWNFLPVPVICLN